MFNPAKASQNIKDEFIDYICTLHAFTDECYQKQLREQLEQVISAGPYVDIKDIFKTGASLKDLMDEGVISSLFAEVEKNKPTTKLYKRKLPLTRPLYVHQEQALRKAIEGRNLIVSTGTGSGKTECFLLPILNELLREKEAGTLGPGVRAMLIYPMNALANDQMKRIREILMYYPDITFGVYNGSTEYEEDEAVEVYKSMFSNERIPELKNPLDNEILSRDKMKETPPNILFTNYAMLEHMLLRPNDDVVFSNADFKFVVLDEAHVYAGATGIETAMLMRRLRARIKSSKPTQFILTSATLGNGDKDNKDDIVKFGNNLCGVEFEKSDIIEADREEYILNPSAINYPIALFEELADESKIASEVLNKWRIPIDKSADEREVIYNLLVSSKLYNDMRQMVKNNALNSSCLTICDFAEGLRITEEQVIEFISLCTRAVKNEKALVDARYHFFVRSLEGCFATISSNPKLFLNRKQVYYENDEQYAVFEVAVCEDCGRMYYVGKIDECERKLKQIKGLEEAPEYFTAYSQKDALIEDDELEEQEIASNLECYYICSRCGSIVKETGLHDLPCDCGEKYLVKVVKADGESCAICRHKPISRFYLGNDAATSVLATALFEELPEEEYNDDYVETESKANPFIKAQQLKRKLMIKTGRQFLAFSDSRQEAARFASYMEMSYNEFLRRRGIWHIAEEIRKNNPDAEYTVSDFVKRLTNYFSTNQTFARSSGSGGNQNAISESNAWVAMLNELYNNGRRTSLTSLGCLQFEYMGNDDNIVETVSSGYGISPIDAKNLLNLLAFEIVRCGAIITDNKSDIGDDEREYIFYRAPQQYIKKESSGKSITRWMPKHKHGKSEGYYTTKKMWLTKMVLGVDDEEAYAFLGNYFDYLIYDGNENKFHMEDINHDATYAMPARHFRVRVKGDSNAKWYRCKKCGKITQFNIGNQCPSINCGGKLEEIDTSIIEQENHYAKLYSGDRMTPLFIKEHTAQLSKKESADYQQQFIKKEINALSCSTTFEMGVDVGDLETVFLRNVPPMPSNYAQRAGRAGRSVNAAAYALTFAKLSSHDFAFFDNPREMISGQIMPPIFKIDNEKIVRRHIYAIALSMFFANHVDMYNGNNADKFINKKGYEEFEKWLRQKPIKLKEMICKSIPNVNELHIRLGINDFSWVDGLFGDSGVFTALMADYESNIESYNTIIKNLQNETNPDFGAIKECQDKLKHYKNNKLIDFLARGNILPKYGFPVDTVELSQNLGSNTKSDIRLSRDLQIAIAEYAPSSEVIANGRMYVSRYIKKEVINKTEDKEWTVDYTIACPVCNCINFTTILKDGITCKYCGESLPKEGPWEQSIEPRNGFVTERKDHPVPLRRPSKNYKSEDYYIGNKHSKTIDTKQFNFNGIGVNVESTTNDTLLVKSLASFYVCKTCGFALEKDEISETRLKRQVDSFAPEIECREPHESLLTHRNCNNKKLQRYSLHHTFNTDVAKLSFDCDTSDYDTMVSVMYALLNSISMELNIERSDIKACLEHKQTADGIHRNSIIIYDAVPGGAGHTRRIITDGGEVLQKIINRAHNQMSNCNCEPSCYRCLRSYYNQKIHDKLNRHLAAEFLAQLIGPIEIVEKDCKNE